MPKKIKVDEAKLIKMVKSGVAQKEIMKQFGLKTATQLKNAYANAAMAKGMIPNLAGGRGGRPKKELSRQVKVGVRGSLTIPRKLAETLGLGVGDVFEVRRSRSGLSLKKTR